MSNHPNRNRANRGIPPASPTPEQIREIRTAASLTQTEAAALVYASLRAWQNWEGDERIMPAAAWELFLIKLHVMKIEMPGELIDHVKGVIGKREKKIIKANA